MNQMDDKRVSNYSCKFYVIIISYMTLWVVQICVIFLRHLQLRLILIDFLLTFMFADLIYFCKALKGGRIICCAKFFL